MVLPLGETEEVLSRLTVQVDPRMTNVCLVSGRERSGVPVPTGNFKSKWLWKKEGLFQLSGTFSSTGRICRPWWAPARLSTGYLARVQGSKVNPPVSEKCSAGYGPGGLSPGRHQLLRERRRFSVALVRCSGPFWRKILQHHALSAVMSFDVRAREVTSGFSGQYSRQPGDRVLQQEIERIWLEGATNLRRRAGEFLNS
jgi:hypothetical protein